MPPLPLSTPSPIDETADGELSIPLLLEAAADRAPTSIAIAAPGRAPLTYDQLRGCVTEARDALNNAGVGRGDRVAMVIPHGPEMAVTFVAVAGAAACAPLNPAQRAHEFARSFSDLRPKALIVQAGIDSPVAAVARERDIPIIELEPVREAPAGVFTLSGGSHGGTRGGAAQPGDTALLLHTSGTTARPKLVPLTHANISSSARTIAATLALSARDRCLNVMPLYHIHGLIGATLASLAGGGSIVCPAAFDAAAFFAWLEEFRPSWYTAVPTIHQAILAAAEEHAEIIAHCPLRFIRSCSAPLPPRVQVSLERAFRAPVVEAYGMTEASHQISSNPLALGRRKIGSVGAATGCEVAVVDEAGARVASETLGEILVRGPNVTAGYEGNPSANAGAFLDGWFRTGDLGLLDAEGYLFIRGRLKEIVNRGGAKISPCEVEDVLLDHPDVAHAVAFGTPHDALGEDLAAAIVLRKPATATEQAIRGFAATRLADFRVPSRILIVNGIPTGATGKVQRSRLADHFGPLLRTPFVPPSVPLEWEIARIWATVLGVPRVGVDDNIFDLGGTSLSAVRILAEIQRITGRNVPLSTLLRAPTVKQLAEVVTQEGALTSWPTMVPIQPTGSRPPFFMIHDGFGHVLLYRHLARHLGRDQPFYGLQQAGLDGVRPVHSRVEDMAAHYVQEIRAFQPEGPYVLGGYSFGALAAYEVARQLCAQGHRVAFAASIDGYFPNNATHARSEIAFILSRMQFHLDNLMELGVGGAARYVVDRLARRLARLSGKPSLPEPAPPFAPDLQTFPALLREVFEINQRAAGNYFPQPYPGRLTIFMARRLYGLGPENSRVPPNLAAGGVETHTVPGDHATMMQEPQVRVLARKLRACLDRVIRSVGDVR
jgi:oxalate---CoA ligase